MIITEESTKITPRNESSPQPVYCRPLPDQTTPILPSDGAGGNERPPPYYGLTMRVPSSVAPDVGAGSAVLVHRYGQSPEMRFLKAFIVGWIVWLLFIALAQSFTMMLIWRRSKPHEKGPGHDQNHRLPSELNYDIPSGVKLLTCARLADWIVQDLNHKTVPLIGQYESAETAFQLPLSSSPNLLLLSRIGHPPQFSSAYVVAADDSLPLSPFLPLGPGNNTLHVRTSQKQKPGFASVRVRAKYPAGEYLSLARACLVKRKLRSENEKGMQSGVGIFTPISAGRPSSGSSTRPPHFHSMDDSERWRSPGEEPHEHSGGGHGPILFDVELVLPEGFALPRLEIDMPDTTQMIHHLEPLQGVQGANLGEVVIRGMNSPVYAKSLHAADIVVSTANASITGSFVVTNTIQLLTRDAPIDVAVELRNSPYTGLQSTAMIETGNAPLTARLSLLSAEASAPESSEYHPSFGIAAATYGAPLTLSVPVQPLNSRLSLSADIFKFPAEGSAYEKDGESGNLASVHLSPAFEGEFRLFADGPGAAIHIKEESDRHTDPSGSQRKRHIVRRDSEGHFVEGSVRWEDSIEDPTNDYDHGEGMVVVSVVSGSVKLGF